MQIFDLEGRRLTLPEANLSFPQILSLQDDPHGVRLRLEITPELDCFRGHFPDEPVLPGVVQLHWAVLIAQARFDFRGVPAELKRLKFKKIVTPPQELELTVSRRNEREVQFNFDSPDGPNSEGRLVFAETAVC